MTETEKDIRIRTLEEQLRDSVPCKTWNATTLILEVLCGTLMVGMFGTYTAGVSQATDRAVKAATSAIYQPVGNGGAMHEYFSGPTEERQKMYDQIEKVRFAIEGPITREDLEN